MDKPTDDEARAAFLDVVRKHIDSDKLRAGIKAARQWVHAHKGELEAIAKAGAELERGRQNAETIRGALYDNGNTLTEVMDAIGPEPVSPDTVLHLLYSEAQIQKLREAEKPDTERGHKVLSGVLQAHEIAHGTAEDKAERWAVQRATYIAARAEGVQKKAAKLIAAEHCGVSTKTIERAFTREGQKLP